MEQNCRVSCILRIFTARMAEAGTFDVGKYRVDAEIPCCFSSALVIVGWRNYVQRQAELARAFSYGFEKRQPQYAL